MTPQDELFREPGITGLEGVVVRELTEKDRDAVVRIGAGRGPGARTEARVATT